MAVLSSIEQRSPEWFAARLGVLTAGSCFKTIMHGRKDGKETLLLEKVAEALTGTRNEATARSLEWGTEKEAEACAEYEFLHGVSVQHVGLIFHPDSPLVACSPDGLIGEHGGIEIKCPYTSKEHVRNILQGMDEKEYGPQVQGNLWITGRQWWDFVSFDPRMPSEHRIYVQRVERDETYIAELAEKTWEMVGRLQQLIGQMTAA